MRVKNLDTVYWIASLGSFRAAAEKLHLTQPAISARIQVLEQSLGTELFVRELKKAELTPAGRKLFGYAERLVVLEQDVLSAFSDTSKIEQAIRVGASETIVTTWLPDFMGSLSQGRENLSFDLRVDSTDNLRNSLVSREIDLTFLMGPVAEASVANQEICKYEMIFAAHADLAGLHENWRLTDIAQHPVLTFASNTKPSRQIREMLAPLCDGAPNTITSASLGPIIRLATSGMGICAVPRAVIDKELRAGTLVALASSVQLPAISFTASYVSASPIAGLISEIIGEVVEFLDDRLIKNFYQI